MRRKNDILWKGILERVCDDFLRFVFPRVDEVLDMDRGFQFLDKELLEMYPEPDKTSHTRHVDKLIKVFEKDGQEKYVLVHVEVQDQTDKEFALRMFEYSYRILDRYKQRMTAIALFTGRDSKGMSDCYETEFLGTRHLYQYNTLRILDYSDEVLAASTNPFAIVLLATKQALLAGKIPEVELLERKLLVARLLYRKGLYTKEKIDGVLAFLNRYIRFEKKETNRNFEQQLDDITGKIHTMDIIEQIKQIRLEEAHEEGRTEEKLNIARNLLKTTEFDVKKIADLVGAPVSFVEKVKAELRSK